MTPPDPARIAAGLTEDERAVLRTAPGAVVPLHLWPALDGLRLNPVPLLTCLSGEVGLTDLGRAVRAALADARDAVGGNPDDGDVR